MKQQEKGSNWSFEIFFPSFQLPGDSSEVCWKRWRRKANFSGSALMGKWGNFPFIVPFSFFFFALIDFLPLPIAPSVKWLESQRDFHRISHTHRKWQFFFLRLKSRKYLFVFIFQLPKCRHTFVTLSSSLAMFQIGEENLRKLFESNRRRCVVGLSFRETFKVSPSTFSIEQHKKNLRCCLRPSWKLEIGVRR